MNFHGIFTSRLVPLPINNVDTDQIIPARFLKTISKQGLDKQLFNDWRYDAQGHPKPDFILNQPRVKGAQILLAGDNFGCGQFARARALGADTVRIPRGDQHLVRGYL
jgi:3-isopropylmalate/(R)-2-methylmalate dehydratase small subunit